MRLCKQIINTIHLFPEHFIVNRKGIKKLHDHPSIFMRVRDGGWSDG